MNPLASPHPAAPPPFVIRASSFFRSRRGGIIRHSSFRRLASPHSPRLPRRLLLTLAALFSLPLAAAAISVNIASPTNGADVSGQVTVSGTAADLGGTGRVSLRIDNTGPFTLAQGTTNWSWSWDTTTVTDGSHTVTARARLSQSDPNPVFHSITVTVNNTPIGLAVSITNPAEGQEISTTLTVTGTSNLATSVSLQIDAGAFQPVNGTDPWNFIIEEGALAPGPHTLTAQASDGVTTVTEAVNITAVDLTTGLQDFTYLSSVDGVSMNSKLYVPTSYNPNGAPTGLVIHLHGGGGLGSISPTHQGELDARGWIGIAPDGRAWGLAQQGCSWQTSAAYVDSPDPNVGPGEQDIFDAIQYAIDHFNINPDRIYLTGFSMGGRGAYMIGLKHPDFFAAIAPMGPAIDMFEIFERRPEPAACKEGMVGGQPGDSPFVDTMYYITSGRFLIENACNLPVFHGHGTIDRVPNNDPTNPETDFLHGSHILFDPSWSGCHGDPLLGLCFGHTPTLSELATAHPGSYEWAYLFTEVAHTNDPPWLTGTASNATNQGVEDPANPGQLIGAYQFFDEHPRVTNPDTIVYKSYTDTHTQAYWADLLIDTPWTSVPGALRAAKGPPAVAGGNALEVELARAHTVTFDLARAQIVLDPATPLTLELSPLDEAVFDPALDATGEALTPTMVLSGDFTAFTGFTVTRDGAPLPAAAVAWTTRAVTIGPLSQINALTTLVVTPQSLPLAAIEPTPAECAAMIPGTALPFTNAAAPASLDFTAADTIELWIIGHSENRGYHTFLQQMLDANPIAGKTFIVRNDWIGGHEAWRWASPGQAGYQKIADHLPELTYPTLALILTSNNASRPIGSPNHDDANFTGFLDDCEAIADHLYNNGNGVAMCYFSAHRYKVSNPLPCWYENHAVASLLERAEQSLPSPKAFLKPGPEQHQLHWCVFPEYFDPDQTHTNALGDELMGQTWYHFLANELAATLPNDFAQWMAERGETDPAHDPAGNGLVNALTYASGADLAAFPHDTRPDGGVTAVDPGGGGGGLVENFFTFSYHLRSSANDVSVAIMSSTDLAVFSDVTNELIPVSTIAQPDGTTEIVVREATPFDAQTGPRFYQALYQISP